MKKMQKIFFYLFLSEANLLSLLLDRFSFPFLLFLANILVVTLFIFLPIEGRPGGAFLMYCTCIYGWKFYRVDFLLMDLCRMTYSTALLFIPGIPFS